jgi:ribosomal protein S18 acetylase RimI-like enzyme
MPTIGAQVIPARLADLRRLLGQLSAADLGALDESLGGWLARPLGREALAAAVLPTAGSTYICMFNLEPAGLMVIERGQLAGRVRALAVAPDLRRRGLARTMLEAADRLAGQAGLRWLWMSVPSANLPATRCALSCGYRRYRPQFMRRQRPQALPLRAEDARALLLDPAEAGDALAHWLALAAQQGDPWCKSLAQADLRSWNVAPLREGRFYRLADPAGQSVRPGPPARRAGAGHCHALARPGHLGRAARATGAEGSARRAGRAAGDAGRGVRQQRPPARCRPSLQSAWLPPRPARAGGDGAPRRRRGA